MKSYDSEVLFCDNHLLVMDKPGGLSTQKHDPAAQSLEEAAKSWVKERFHKQGAVFLHPIHRLDKAVSGVVLFARTSKALSRLQESMRQGSIHKSYRALVSGSLDEQSGTLRHFLLHGDHKALLGKEGQPGAKEAILHFQVIERREQTSLLQLDLITGRYHQIRAQLAAIGHPVIGDGKYGSAISYKKEQIALLHAEMRFPHPVTKETVSFRSRKELI